MKKINFLNDEDSIFNIIWMHVPAENINDLIKYP